MPNATIAAGELAGALDVDSTALAAPAASRPPAFPACARRCTTRVGDCDDSLLMAVVVADVGVGRGTAGSLASAPRLIRQSTQPQGSPNRTAPSGGAMRGVSARRPPVPTTTKPEKKFLAKFSQTCGTDVSPTWRFGGGDTVLWGTTTPNPHQEHHKTTHRHTKRSAERSVSDH